MQGRPWTTLQAVPLQLTRPCWNRASCPFLDPPGDLADTAHHETEPQETRDVLFQARQPILSLP